VARKSAPEEARVPATSLKNSWAPGRYWVAKPPALDKTPERALRACLTRAPALLSVPARTFRGR